MPLEDGSISKEPDGSFNEDYCRWCYADGKFMYHNMDDLIDVCVKHMAEQGFSEEQARSYMKEMLPKLDYWKQGKELEDDGVEDFKQKLVEEFNSLNIEGMPKVEKLNALVGAYVNIEYPLPNGKTVKLLDDNATYLGDQLESELGDGRFFGVIANSDILMVASYGKDITDPELILYKKR